MDYRPLGKSALQVSSLGFGCGAVGGILVRGQRREMIEAVGRAIELGINYFDTAAIYGDGASETNLGMALREVGADAIVGTKVQLQAGDLDDMEGAVRRSVEASLGRLGRESVDLIQLHNFVAPQRVAERQWLGIGDVGRVMGVFARLRDEGKVRFWGMNGLGDPTAVRQCLGAQMHSMQVCYNLLNPTAGIDAPRGFPFPDHGRLIDMAAESDVGVLAIRVLAGGALSGSVDRSANAAPQVAPIASGGSYADDARLARRFGFLVEEGHAQSVIDAAIRFAIGRRGVSSAVIGISTLEQLEEAAASAGRGPLPPAAHERLHTTWAGLGEGS